MSVVLFFKQKTAYEMRISDWSSDVCSSDLDLRSGRWLGAELLVRWNHPERGPLAPDEFVPMAEQARVIGAMNLHLLRRGLQQRRQWPQAEPPLQLSVNVSANDRSEEHTSELQTIMSNTYAVLCLITK